MKTADCDILIVPGLGDSGPDHWQSRWERRLPTARRIRQDDFDRPDRDDWSARIVGDVEASTRPVVLVAHSLGVIAVIHAADRFATGKVRAGFLVAPVDTTRTDLPPVVTRTFGPVPRDPLPFASMVIASRDDPFCAFDVADDLAAAWGSDFVDAGEAGHINVASGFGPWPEGLTRFATLLGRV
jgi:predicted alpha/beta hydrolase family esterase